MKKIYASLFLAAFYASNLIGQCMLYPVSLSERVTKSSIILEGKVLSKKSFWNEAHNNIYTSNLVEVNQVLKGNLLSSHIEVITAGGTVELFKITVEPSLQLHEEETGVFMINAVSKNSQFGYSTYEVFSDQQGFVKFDLEEGLARDPFTTYADINEDLYKKIGSLLGVAIAEYKGNNTAGKIFLPAASTAAAVTGISPTTSTAGTFSILTITGSGFGTVQNASNYVSFRNADDGGATFIQPHASQYVSWTNTQIQVRIPSKTTQSGTAGTGVVRVTVANSSTNTAQTLTINHGEINLFYTTNNTIYNTRHVELNTTGGITWQMFTGFNSNAPAKASFIRALQTWRCNTFINWPLGNTVSTNVMALDGVSVVRFDIGSELPAGVLGVCQSYFAGCSSGPNVFWHISELDICFDSGTTWQYGPANATAGQIDFESVALHELGHGHQLSHVINNSNVMHYSIGPAVNKRTLSSTDIIGGNNVMSRNVSAGICGKNAMTQISASTCSISVPTASFNLVTSVCVNQPITLTNLSTGGPTSFTWTMTGGTPASANTLNSSVTYATPGIKTISLVVANGVGTSAILSKTINVVAGPVITVSSATTCAGTPVNLTASGSTTSYTWSPGALVGASQNLNPANTTVYSVTGSNGVCNGVGTGTVSVTLLPNMNVNNALICQGSTTVLSVNGASSYTWNPGALIGAIQTLGPAATTIYTITGSNNSCLNTRTVSVVVNVCSGVNTVSNDLSLKLFPNPTKGIVTIETVTPFSGTINVINSLGQLVISKEVSAKKLIEIDLVNEANGIYILKLNTINGSDKTVKLIKE